MSAMANAFKRASGVPEEQIQNKFKDPYYTTLAAAENVRNAKPIKKQSQEKKDGRK